MNETILAAPIEQLWKSPATIWVIIPVSIVAILLELWRKFPSTLVPWVCILMGSALYPNLVRVDTVPKEFPKPMLVLVLAGLTLGFFAAVFHGLLFKLLLKKFLPDGFPMPAFLTTNSENQNERNNDPTGK